jgi:hypothetical protein
VPQLSHFPDGGYVVHKARLDGSPCTFSAWFDKAGKLVDAERFTERARFYGHSGTRAGSQQQKRLQRRYGNHALGPKP